jgi:HlyD family secretion protein
VLLAGVLLAGLGAGCGPEATAAGGELWATVTRADLVIEVDVTGALRATRSSPIGPPSGLEEDEFKIARMVPEGDPVKKGAKVLFFDAGEVERELIDRTAERDSAAREIERKLHDIELGRREAELRVTEAEAAARKARLKADLPEKYTAAVELKLARIDLEAAEAELQMAQQRLQHSVRLGAAELQYLRDRHARFAARVARMQAVVERLTVTAPIDGVVVYRTNWRGEKKKVGDDCSVGEPCLEITDVTEMEALAEVDEVESARVAEGQTVRFRLEALPETEWTGKVVHLRPNVYRQSPRTPIKVIGARVKLERTDPSRMRPGMQLRGRLETGRLTNVVLAPLDAIFAGPQGPVAHRKTGAGWDTVPVELGRRSRTQVEVKRGLAPGDRIARRDLAEEVTP